MQSSGRGINVKLMKMAVSAPFAVNSCWSRGERGGRFGDRMSVTCPVCQASTRYERAISERECREALSKYYDTAVPSEVVIEPAIMRRCNACDLVFSEAMRPGDGAFYTWITRQSGYYPGDRWEWSEVLAAIRASEGAAADVIDVGCGSGDFLTALAKALPTNAIGIDTTPASIDDVRARGLHGECVDISGFRQAHPDRLFDFCLSFHCIEHVSDPLDVTRQLKSLLKPGGKLLISAPYSPMSFEDVWFDPLNYPPHHLTRWNRRAIETLAEQLGMALTLITSPAAPLHSRVLRAVQLATSRRASTISALRKLALAATNPSVTMTSFKKQAAREKVCGSIAGDTFLAIMQ